MKADFIYGLPQALAEIKDLKAAALQLQADRQAERIVLARVIMELEEEREKTAALSGQLQQKDACILSLQKHLSRWGTQVSPPANKCSILIEYSKLFPMLNIVSSAGTIAQQ